MARRTLLAADASGAGWLNWSAMKKTLEQRFWEKVDVRQGDCWPWIGSTQRGNRDLYGVISVNGKHARAHRVSHELLIGPIPDGYDVDHLCRNTLCVNPDHLEAVTHQVNILRGQSPLAENGAKTHCVHGHEFTPENTYERPSGGRDCRTCRAEKIKRWKQENREKLERENEQLGEQLDEARSLLRDLEEAAKFVLDANPHMNYSGNLRQALAAVAQARKDGGFERLPR